MDSIASTLSHAANLELPILIQSAFQLYVLLSFIGVAAYGVTQIRTGRFLDNGNAPARWNVPPLAGWLFILCVLNLLFLQSAFYMILVATGLSLFLIDNQRSAKDQFGFERLPVRKLLKWSLFVCGAAILVEIPLTWGLDKVMTALHVPHPEQESVVVFRQFNKPGQIISFLLQAVLLAPLIEEFFFRGFLLTFLKNYTSTWLALILSAGVFAFAHANLGSALPLWLLGIILGIAYEHTGCLLLPIGIHACFNLMTAMSLLLDKGSS